MNSTQLTTTVAPIVSFIAGILAGKGLFGLDATAWATIIGAIVAFGATVWGAFTTRKTALVTTVANMPEVDSVRVDTTQSGAQALVNSTPSNVTATR